MLIGSFLEHAIKNAFGPPEIGPVESTNTMDSAHEDAGVNKHD